MIKELEQTGLILICFLSLILPKGSIAQNLMANDNHKQRNGPSVSQAASDIHNSALIIDTHADTTQRLLDEDFDLTTNTPIAEGQFDLQKARAGNLAAEFFSIWVEPKEYKGRYAHRTLQLIDSVLQQARKHSDKMTMAYSADDIVKSHSAKPPLFAALMGIEGGHSIENDIGLLRDYYRLGVRYMTLSWSNTNEWADSSGDENDPKVVHHNGLTEFGKDVVREMNRLGMMVDISHVSDKTFYKALLISRAPVIASHSSSRALTNHPRNMTDDMLRAVARNNGVVMVNFYTGFVDQAWRQQYDALAPQRNAAIEALDQKLKDASPAVRYRELEAANKEWAAKIPRPPLKSLIDHIDHIAQVAGIDHVGLGSDFDGIPALPEGIDSVADLPVITEALVQRGYTREQLHKLLGENLLRVFRDCQRISAEMNQEASTSLH